MSKAHDKLAQAAMVGLLSNPKVTELAANIIARRAHQIADEMLVVRNSRKANKPPAGK